MKAKTAVRYSAKRSISRNRNDPASARIGPHTSRLPIRVLTAVPICDGHDSAINTLNLEFIRHGIEVVYLGYHRSARDIVRAAVQEDVRAIGISSYNGGHVEFFAQVIDLLKEHAAGDIGVFGAGGGTITPSDARAMKKKGVDRIFFAGTPLAEMIEWVRTTYAHPTRPPVVRTRPGHQRNGRELARQLTLAELAVNGSTINFRTSKKPCRVVGVTGPGGAGKTTLIDELVARCLRADSQARLAILSHDPSLVGRGALLGDRATMIYSQNDRVFMRSLATQGQAGGLSPATERCLRILKCGGFDLVLVETVGVGQEAMPFSRELVDQTILVLHPEYGSRLQLQKIVMLEVADIIVVNKSDLAGAKTAAAEIEQRLVSNHRGQKLVSTVASRHRDPGVEELFRLVKS
jgi:methylmalonyl-CoA mutase